MMVEMDGSSDANDYLDDHRHDEFFKKNCFKADYRLSNNLKEILYMYAQVDLPFTQRDPDLIELNQYKKEMLNEDKTLLKEQTHSIDHDSSAYQTIDSLRYDEKSFLKIQKLKGWVQVCCQSQLVALSHIVSQNYLSLYLVYLTIRMSRLLEKHLPQYSCVNGATNTWICKPSYNARGLGIFCINKRNDIINIFFKKASGPKVI